MAIKGKPHPRRSASLEYGLAILGNYDREHSALGISDIADMLGLSRSTAHRYAATLVVLGYLEQNDKRKYRLAYLAGRVGMAGIDTLRREIPAARTILEDLRRETGYTVSMGVLDGASVIYIHRLLAHGRGQYEVDLGLGVGARVPVYCTAIGKALLASLSEPQQREILPALALRREGPKTIMAESVLAGQLSSIRASGLAVCDEEQARDVRSIAAVIPRPGRSRPMAISVTVPAGQYTVKKLTARFGALVKAAAERI
jgi:IclR family pca regulon transcriptional regulator